MRLASLWLLFEGNKADVGVEASVNLGVGSSASQHLCGVPPDVSGSPTTRGWGLLFDFWGLVPRTLTPPETDTCLRPRTPAPRRQIRVSVSFTPVRPVSLRVRGFGPRVSVSV